MHLLERYALSCGVKINAPRIEEAFFPLPYEKYIVLHASSGMKSKNYDYYNDVVELIAPHLDDRKIKIIQIGGKDDLPIKNAHRTNGHTGIKQVAYLIKNSLLVVGNDSFSSHIASGYGLKSVTVFGGSNYLQCCGPYWNDKGQASLIESHRKGHKPSFAADEEPKTINYVHPEKVASAILSQLSIPHDLNKIQTLHMGSLYHLPALDVVPDHAPQGSVYPGSLVHLRLDYNFNQEVISSWCGENRRVILITKKELDLNLLRQLKPSIAHVVYELDEKANHNYIINLQGLGIPITLLTKANDLSEVQSLRLKFTDWIIDHQIPRCKKDLDSEQEIDYNVAFYKSSKVLLSKGQEFPSKAAWMQNIPKTPDSIARIIDTEDFWEELNHYRIFKTKT